MWVDLATPETLALGQRANRMSRPSFQSWSPISRNAARGEKRENERLDGALAVLVQLARQARSGRGRVHPEFRHRRFPLCVGHPG